MFTGLVVGLVVGLVIAAGLAWYFNLGSSGFKPATDIVPPAKPKADTTKTTPPVETTPIANADKPSPPKVEAHLKKPAPPAETTAPATKPRVDYTFYGILPGEKPAKPIEPPKPKELWWLQVVALKNPADADKLKARLSLLGLDVSTQKVESGGQYLYRVRVGPYKREDDAFGDLDILAANNFEPRLLKDPVNP